MFYMVPQSTLMMRTRPSEAYHHIREDDRMAASSIQRSGGRGRGRGRVTGQGADVFRNDDIHRAEDLQTDRISHGQVSKVEH